MRHARLAPKVIKERPAPPRRKRPMPRVQAYWRFAVRETCSVIAKIMSLITFAALFLLLLLDGSQVLLPKISDGLQAWATSHYGAPDVTIGSVEFSLGQGDVPAGLILNDVELSSGEVLVHLPQIKTSFLAMDGLQGQFKPKSIDISGGQLNFTRDGQNRVFVQSSPDAEPVLIMGNNAASDQFQLAEVLSGLTELDNIELLDDLSAVNLTGMTVSFEDKRSGRIWISTDASIRVSRDAGTLSGSMDASLVTADGPPMQLAVRVASEIATGKTELSTNFKNIPPADLATQVKVLDWMGVIEGRVTGHLVLSLDETARLQTMSGVLELGAGAVEPVPGQRIRFDGAKSYFSFDPDSDVFDVQEMVVDTSFGQLTTAGKVLVERDGTENSVAALVAQMDVTRLNVTAQEFLAHELSFDAGHVTSRVSFDPFRIDIGEAVLQNGDARIAVDGRVRPGVDTWDIALNAQVSTLSHAQALDLWPENFRPLLRGWLDRQIAQGQLDQMTAHLRTPEGKPKIALDFAFSDAEVSILSSLPSIKGGVGRGTLIDNTLTIIADKGFVEVDGAGNVDLAGTRFIVEDTRQRQAEAIAILEGTGSIPSMLRLVNYPPLGLLDLAGQKTDLADGRATAVAELRFRLKKDLKASDVAAAVTAQLSDVTSDNIVSGRHLSADTLTLVATNTDLSVYGDALMSEVPINFTYAQGFGPESSIPPTVKGTLPVTMANLARLGVELPKGSLDGTGSGRFQLDLRGEDPPRYAVTVGLGNTGLSVPELSWNKRPGADARIALSGILSDPVTVEKLDFSAPGLSANGKLILGATKLKQANFNRLKVGRWLDAPVVYKPYARGGASAAVTGGLIDLRHSPTLEDGGSGASSMTLTLSPNEVVVSDGITLTGFSGEITTKGGTRGRFRARVNGGAEITGVVQPGSAIFVQGRDGGQVLHDAGLFEHAKGGTLRVSLTPLASGVFDGRFSLQNTRAIDAPVLAELLSLVSIFGLIDRLNGPGIAFDNAQGWFTLSEDQMTITRARATGASMGVTLSGTYLLDTGRLNMEGVLSPLYFVNGIAGRIPGLGRILGGRPGEGVLGASFRVSGTADDPRTLINPLSLLTPGAAREIFSSRPALQPARN